MRLFLSILVIVFVWLLVGCRQLGPPPGQITLVSTTTKLPDQPVGTVAISTPTRRPTLVIPSTAIPATPVTAPDILGTLAATQTPKILPAGLSPNGEWQAEVIAYGCSPIGDLGEYAYEQLKLIRLADKDEKIVDNQEIACGSLGAFGFEGLFWSPNSRFFYYTDAREGTPDGCGYWVRPVLRLDTTSLTVDSLGGGLPSPDGARLATWQGRELVIWDVNQGETGRTIAKITTAVTGPIAWSPDGQALVYLQLTADCPVSGVTYAIRLDLPEMAPTILLESDSPSFAGVQWETPDKLRLFDGNGKAWQYHFATKAIVPVP